MNNKKLKKLRQMIAKSHKEAYDTEMYFYTISGVYLNDIERRYARTMINCWSLYKHFEVFTKKRYYTEMKVPSEWMTNYTELKRIVHSEFNFKIHSIDPEELAREAFKPERLMYQLSFDPDYDE